MTINRTGRFRGKLELSFSGEVDWRLIGKMVIALATVALTIRFGPNLPPILARLLGS